MKITYYSYTPLKRKEPTALYRFFDDDNKAPEVYRVGEGWIESNTLWPRLASGEISDDNIISEEKAAEIVKKLGGTL